MMPARAANFFMVAAIVSSCRPPHVLGGAILGPMTTLEVDNG